MIYRCLELLRCALQHVVDFLDHVLSDMRLERYHHVLEDAARKALALIEAFPRTEMIDKQVAPRYRQHVVEELEKALNPPLL